MSIVEQAKIEMEAANFSDDDKRVMVEILEKFFGQWNSGGAVWAMAPVLPRLICGQPLSPLTGEDGEWLDPMGDGISLQNARCGSVFKNWTMPDGGFSIEPGIGRQVCKDIDNPAWNGEFPYLPPQAEVADPVIIVP